MSENKQQDSEVPYNITLSLFFVFLYIYPAKEKTVLQITLYG